MVGTSVTAVLGPTNTGKTHRAIERMLEHDSGMIGLPLRLLAREVYDKISARIGEARVALITGEEKRVPRRPDYWICTTEAMPTNRDVDFVAVDEIQLAGHTQRGHVFTERLLELRGKRETWFLGAASMIPMVANLLPAAKIVEHPRLSRLTFSGESKLTHLPPRTAIVAFSMQDVYDVAERLRAQRGGAAVVLGALSPRTRNAQVAMFQSGEVDYLVATDAIGMGLNLDVKHVAFASMRKFDGREARELDLTEVGQIAGRAGRYTTNGSFGTLAPLSLSPAVANLVENHRFPKMTRLVWRNSALDFESIDKLLTSLRQAPPHRGLSLQARADDALALEKLAADPWIRRRAVGTEAVGLLWEVCRIPDYRKLLFESHVELLAELFGHLASPRGVVDEQWMSERVKSIDDASGDIDTLIARIQSVRTWTYVSYHDSWVHNAAEWQAHTASIEDRLSDALHERLVQRFVEKSGRGRTVAGPKMTQGGGKEHNASGRGSSTFEKLDAWKASQAAKGVQTDSTAAWAEKVIAAHHTQLALDGCGRILFEGERVLGTLSRGTSLILPDVRIADTTALGAGVRARIQRRLHAFARDLVVYLLLPLQLCKSKATSASVRGILFRLEERLGTALTIDAVEQIAELTQDDRNHLASSGIVLGHTVIYVPALLRGHALVQRAALVGAFAEREEAPQMPQNACVSVPAIRSIDKTLYTAMGYPVFGPRAIRADIAERVFSMLAGNQLNVDSRKLATLLGCPAREVRTIVGAAIDVETLKSSNLL